jgi:hypothetical protein
VDISRPAGLAPSGVICEVINANGSMARLLDLIGGAPDRSSSAGKWAAREGFGLSIPRHEPLAE